MNMYNSSVKMMGLAKFLYRKRSMKIYARNTYYSHVFSRNHHKAASIHSLTSFKRTYCYMQTSPCSYIPGNSRGKGSEQLLEEPKPIRKGDVVNLHDLLFTKNRDYLVRYNGEKVKAEQLAGKVIVLEFAQFNQWLLDPDDNLGLRETYTYLLPDNVLEIVWVAYEAKRETLSVSNSQTRCAEMFEAEFSSMPWTAIPFSDIASREHLLNRFGIDRQSCAGGSFVIDSSGMVLQSNGFNLFDKYGGLGYPFTDERIQFLKSQVVATVMQPSLKSLLASPKRDYLISNKGDKVLIDTLEGKTVALYFYENGFTFDGFTERIKKVYEELGQNNFCFEVVLVYLYDTFISRRASTSEESFWNTFKSMPWLALPFNDPKCRELGRYFGYPFIHLPEEPPTLVIIGPYAKFIEPWGAKIICKFKRSAYPFTREKLAELDIEKVRELKLDMLWDPNTLFRGKDGSEVRFSQLVGKRIILFFEGEYFRQKVVEFLSMLEERYLHMKNTSDEFEVIYITNIEKESPYSEQIANMQWFVSMASELLPIDRSLYRCYCHLERRPFCHHGSRLGGSSILAFDQDGKIVRKSLELSFDHTDFPFYAGGMQKEAFNGLNHFYRWSDLDLYHRGPLINSYHRKTLYLPRLT